MPTSEFPWFRGRLSQQAPRLLAENADVADHVRERIRTEGPLSALDFERKQGATTDWFGMPTNTVRAVLEAYTVTGVMPASFAFPARDIEIWRLGNATARLERYPRMDTLVEVEGEPSAIEQVVALSGIPRSEFTAEPLVEFVRRFEARTGVPAELSVGPPVAVGR